MRFAMMMCVIALSLATASTGHSETVPGLSDASATPAASDLNFGIGLLVGTSGLGGQIALPISPQHLNARFGVNYFYYRYNKHASKVEMDLTMQLHSYEALIDWFVFGGSFRVTTGIIYNASRIDAAGKPTIAGSYIINGRIYNANDVGSLHGKLTLPRFVPYLGFGYGNMVDDTKRWSFFSDTGVMINSNPAGTIRAAHCTAPQTACDRLDRDIDAMNDSLRSGLGFLRLYPILRVGIGYRF